MRCRDCGWIDKTSRKNQAEFVCSGCGFTCNAEVNSSINVAADRTKVASQVGLVPEGRHPHAGRRASVNLTSRSGESWNPSPQAREDVN
ncbi:hypothetical protein ACWDKQ_25390 [Saccharopolyspora sp. NPDC000995]